MKTPEQRLKNLYKQSKNYTGLAAMSKDYGLSVEFLRDLVRGGKLLTEGK